MLLLSSWDFSASYIHLLPELGRMEVEQQMQVIHSSTQRNTSNPHNNHSLEQAGKDA